MADALHHVAVAGQHVGVVIDDLVPVAVEAGGQVALGQRHADGVGEALSQRARRDLDAGGAVRFRMAGRHAADLAEVLELAQGQVVSVRVQQSIEQGGRVARGQEEPVAVRPFRVGGVVLHDPGPQGVGHGGAAQRRARVAGVGGVDHVNGQRPERVHAQFIQAHVFQRHSFSSRWTTDYQIGRRAVVRQLSRAGSGTVAYTNPCSLWVPVHRLGNTGRAGRS